MILLASFNGGPSGAAFIFVLMLSAVAAVVIGYKSCSVVAGAFCGSLACVVLSFLMIASSGAFLGAEIIPLVFGMGGAILGGVAGLVGRRKNRE